MMTQSICHRVALLNQIGIQLFEAQCYEDAINRFKEALMLLSQTESKLESNIFAIAPLRESSQPMIMSHKIRRRQCRGSLKCNPTPFVFGGDNAHEHFDCWRAVASMAILYNMSLVHFTIESYNQVELLLQLILQTSPIFNKDEDEDFLWENLMPDIAQITVTTYLFLGCLTFMVKEEESDGESGISESLSFLLLAIKVGQTYLNGNCYLLGYVFVSMGQILLHAKYFDEAALALEEAHRIFQESELCFLNQVLNDNNIQNSAAAAA
jgi:tetratricopeptide (TPR) repeat protein